MKKQSLLEAMFREATLGILVVNKTGKIVHVNPAAINLFGYLQEELIDQTVDMLVPDSYRKGHHVHRDHYHEKPEPRLMGAGRDLFGKRKDGIEFPIEISLSATEVEGERFVVAFVNDISERKKSEDALQENKSRTEAIINTAVDGIMTINRKGIVESINPAAAKLFGYEPTEVIGNNIKMLMPEPDHSRHDGYLHNYKHTRKKKIIGSGREVTGKKKDGTRFPFHLSVNETKLKDKVIYTGILHDLTEQKLAEEKLKRVAKNLERSNRELQDFAYVSSHDLQEPLRKIRAFGDRLKMKDSENFSDKGMDYLNRMLNAAERMQTLITDLLQFSRVSTRIKPFEKISLNEVIEGVLSDLEISIEKNNAKVEVGTLPEIEADPTQMRQLFQNLISNAIKFRKEDTSPHIIISGNQLQRTPHLIATPGDAYIEVTVEDNGIGFDDKYKNKIFQIFQRLEGRKYEGSGIGLAICKRIANLHGGDIDVQSQEGKGTTFTINLAVKQTVESSEDSEESQNNTPPE